MRLFFEFVEAAHGGHRRRATRTRSVLFRQRAVERHGRRQRIQGSGCEAVLPEVVSPLTCAASDGGGRLVEEVAETRGSKAGADFGVEAGLGDHGAETVREFGIRGQRFEVVDVLVFVGNFPGDRLAP